MDKGLLWVGFIWLIIMIIINLWKGRKEKRESMIISKEGMKSYSVTNEILKKRELEKKHFNGRFKW